MTVPASRLASDIVRLRSGCGKREAHGRAGARVGHPDVAAHPLDELAAETFDLTLPAVRPQPGALKSCKTMSTLSPAIVTHVGQRALIRMTIA